MRLATSTNIISYHRSGKRLPMTDVIPLLADEGYRVLDLNFCEMMNPQSPLSGDQWHACIDALAGLKDRYGIVYNQSHAPYAYDRFGVDAADGGKTDALIHRAVAASGELGVPWVILHAATDPASSDPGESKRKNLAWLSPFVETAAAAGTAIALENLDFGRDGKPEYTSRIGDVCALVDAFNSPLVGACYDFGHAHLAGGTHQENLAELGNRLVALHVADNHGTADEHLLPFYGTIPWEICMKALADIGYRGDLTYEVMFFTRYLPEELKRSMLRHSLDVGRYLLELFDSAGNGR